MKSCKSYSIALVAAFAVTLGSAAPMTAVAATSASSSSITANSLGATPAQLQAARELGMSDQMLREAAQMTDAQADRALADVEQQLATAFAEVDKAATYDAHGRLVSIDSQQLLRQYPNDPQLAEIISAINQDVAAANHATSSRSMDSFTKCVFNESLKGLGADVIKAMWGDNVRDAIAKKQWGSVANIALKNLEKKLGKKAAAKVAKFVASKFLPGGPAVGLAWVTAKCGWREF